MCGRYDHLIPRDAHIRLFRPQRLPETNFPPRYNVAPTDPIPIIRVDPRDGKRELTMMRWGLVPFFSKAMPKQPLINARAETVDRLPAFREAFARRRALIPATGYFEWQQRSDGKQPYRFVRRDREPMAFAGLWEFCRIGETDVFSASIIVGAANPLTAAIHDRMPVILDAADFDAWLDLSTPPADLRAMLKPFPEHLLEAYPVNRAVNSVRNDDERCIERVEPPVDDLIAATAAPAIPSRG